MRISSIQSYKPCQPVIAKQSRQDAKNNKVSFSTPVFNGVAGIKKFSPKFLSAQEYLKSAFLTGKVGQNPEIYDFNLNKLDGIQEGIKVFNGLNMKEIAFIAQTITEAAVIRGCRNICSHCYAGGQPPLREDENHINKMSWNDFEALTEGYKQLNERLGFSITKNRRGVDPYMTAFHDADSIDMLLKDNSGREHDFIDISEALSSAFGLKLVFDTAGWSPKNKKAQARAEKYAQYYSKKENARKINQFNMSVNPYHVMHSREVELIKNGEAERARKFRDLYTDRMANVLYTFTPLIETGRLNFLARAAAEDSLGTDGFRESDLRKLYDEIFNKLIALYMKDYRGERKFIKDISQMDINVAACKMMLFVDTSPSVTERLSKIYAPEDEIVLKSNEEMAKSINTVKNAKTVQDLFNTNKYGDMNFAGLLDSNGHYYLTDFYTTFPTELQLNFENKDKLTAPIQPYLQKELVISKNLINSINYNSP